MLVGYISLVIYFAYSIYLVYHSKKQGVNLNFFPVIYLPIDLLAYIALRTGIKPAKVLGVTTFYTQFRTKPVGKHLILLCQGTACHVNGAADIETAIREELAVEEGEITPDGLFTYNNVACLGCCSLSPVMMIGEDTYGMLTADKAKAIIAAIRKEAQAQ